MVDWIHLNTLMTMFDCVAERLNPLPGNGHGGFQVAVWMVGGGGYLPSPVVGPRPVNNAPRHMCRIGRGAAGTHLVASYNTASGSSAFGVEDPEASGRPEVIADWFGDRDVETGTDQPPHSGSPFIADIGGRTQVSTSWVSLAVLRSLVASRPICLGSYSQPPARDLRTASTMRL